MPEIITKADAQYALDIVKTICTEVGPGLPGSSQERARAAMIQKELELHLGAGNVVVEEFTVAPGTFLGTQRLSALCVLIAALLNIALGRLPGISPWVTAVAALAFAIIPLFLYIFQFTFNFEIADRFYEKETSVNVIGTLRQPGTQNVKRLLMLSGHHDSAWENNWIRWLGYGFFFAAATMLIGFSAILVVSLIQLAGVITNNADIVRAGTLSPVLLVYPIVPAIIVTMFFHGGGKDGGNVPGAADNLSASALVVAMCRFLVNNPAYIPADTEIRFVSFGSEEAGLRGSRRYVARHLDELKRLDARLLNFEIVAYPEIGILATDGQGTTKHSPEVVKSVTAAAECAGVPYQVKSASIGAGTDAVSFTKAGLKAAALLCFKSPQQLIAFYHQRRDVPEVLTLEPLLNGLKLTFEWIRTGGE